MEERGGEVGGGEEPAGLAGPKFGMVESRQDVEELARRLEAATHCGVSGLAEALPADSLLEMLKRAADVLNGEPTLVEVKVQEANARVNVVGDTHGQYHDVLKMFSVVGRPSKGNLFIFNGDYVDRGAWGLETLTLFLAWKLVCPGSVAMLRGNHESFLCTRSYGFHAEVKAKYPGHHKKVYAACKKIFARLPLAAIVEGNTLVLHGGLFRKEPASRPAKRRKIGCRVFRRRVQAPLVLGTLEDLQGSSKGGIDPCGMGSTTVAGDVLWSDPSGVDGMSMNVARGVGIVFGPDVTEQFLKENDLKLIIRSHEGPDARLQRDDLPDMMKGYSTDHSGDSGKLMTVFSAPDYPQFQEGESRIHNEGAVLVLTGPDFAAPEAKCFQAAPRPEYGGPFYDVSMFPDSDIDLGVNQSATSGSELTPDSQTCLEDTASVEPEPLGNVSVQVADTIPDNTSKKKLTNRPQSDEMETDNAKKRGQEMIAPIVSGKSATGESLG